MDAHVSHPVDCPFIDAGDSMESPQPKDRSGKPPGPCRNGERDFHGEKRTNETHASRTDPDARLYRKSAGRESRLCYMGHPLMENINGLAVIARLTHATGKAEHEAALDMIGARKMARRFKLGANKSYYVSDFFVDLRQRNVAAHCLTSAPVGQVRAIA